MKINYFRVSSLCLVGLIFVLLSFLLLPGKLRAASGWVCFGATIAEYLIPGLGYGLLGDFDKMFILGGTRWAALNKYYSYSESPNYLKNTNQIYKKKDLGEGRYSTDIYYSSETFYGRSFANIYSNLTLVSFYDMYESNCEENSETYALMFSPFRIWDYGDEWTFWVPSLYIAGVPMETELNTYHVDNDLTRQEMLQQSFLEYQLVGIGEEMLFRGVIQRSLFNFYSRGFSKEFSRWGSIITGSAVFGAAHSGQGFSANPGVAFLAGLYLGWVYHPADGEFDLVQPIAIHSWWDTILIHRNLQGANFVERDSGETALNATLKHSDRIYPLFGVRYNF